MIARPAPALPFRLSLFSLVVLLFAAPALAQFDTAQVSGTVQDSSGAVLPGVDVVLVATATGLERRAVTNESGIYTFPNVTVGDYRINASLDGFKPIARTGVRVNAGLNIRVDLSLEIGGLTEIVQVQAATTLVEVGFAGLGYVLDAWTRVPYLSRGDGSVPAFVLDDAIFVISPKD